VNHAAAARGEATAHPPSSLRFKNPARPLRVVPAHEPATPTGRSSPPQTSGSLVPE
jgi:hypothetical protein